MKVHAKAALTGAGAVAFVAAVSVTVVAWPDSGSGGLGAGPPPGYNRPTEASGISDEKRPSPSPSPTVSHPLSKAPRTIPAVREHEAAHGPGWRTSSGARVVIGSGDEELTDEAQLLAGELKIGWANDVKAGPGDIELAIDPKATGDSESYTLVVGGDQVRITAPTEAGVFYGTRTLKQSLKADGAMPEGTVRDEPERPQRGLMIDTARKHFTAEWIEARMREMADLKLNQLGLHFSDDQGFRIESTSHPEVVSDQRLTKAEVRSVLALADRLHITVIPEIDSPGHLGAVLAAHPDLQLRSAGGTAVRGAIDISKPASAAIVDDLLREYAQLFPGAYWHLGGDEYQALVYSNPEASFPALAAAARQKYGSGASVKDLATGWLNDRAATARSSGKTVKAWNDGFFRGGTVTADKDIEAEYWTGKEFGAREPTEYLAAGRKVVNLNDEFLYYVLGEPNAFAYPTGERIYEDWNPLVLRGAEPVPAKYAGQILGARLAVWCDLSDAQTPDQVAEGIRMPMTALAQKIWDPATGKPKVAWVDFTALAKEMR